MPLIFIIYCKSVEIKLLKIANFGWVVAENCQIQILLGVIMLFCG
jgi:hypothetical protein